MKTTSEKVSYGSVHMGQLIRNILRQKQISVLDFARRNGLSKAHTYRLFKQSHISLDRLRTVSKILEMDLCAYLVSDQSKERLKGEQLGQLQSELDAAKEMIAHLRKELYQQTDALKACEAQYSGQVADLQQRLIQSESTRQSVATDYEASITALEDELNTEKADRVEAQIQTRILEGKLEVLREKAS